MELLEVIDRCIAGASVLCVVRMELAESDMLCIPVARSDELLLTQVFYDFRPDGYRIVRLADIYDVFREESEIFFERILMAEGVYTKLRRPRRIRLGSWKQAVEDVKAGYDYCILECEQEEDFLIGKIVETARSEFTFWYFDAAGKWDEELDVVEYEALTSITFDDNYTNTITKYIQRPQ